MSRFGLKCCADRHSPSRGFTLLEILTATALTLIMLAGVITVFGTIGTSVSESRATLELGERLRSVSSLLQSDLAGATAPLAPQVAPEANQGYFEIVEGPRGIGGALMGTSTRPLLTPVAPLTDPALNSLYTLSGVEYHLDTTVGDNDDILMFTTRSTNKPFSGRCGVSGAGVPMVVESPVAEVAWFVRGRTLYRRVLLVAPTANLASASTSGFYLNYDISARVEGATIKANTLGDLTKRENRFAHPNDVFPYDVRRWTYLGLPTLAECSQSGWPLRLANLPSIPTLAPTVSSVQICDFLSDNITQFPLLKLPSIMAGGVSTATDPPRATEDVVLTNVIGFDVKVWDPGAPILKRTLGNEQVAMAPGDLGYYTDNALAGSISGALSMAVSGYGAYVDLGYPLASNYSPYLRMMLIPQFCSYRSGGSLAVPQMARSRWQISGSPLLPSFKQEGDVSGVDWVRGCVYDTWSLSYNRAGQLVGTSAVQLKGTGTNGYDDTPPSGSADGVVDDINEMELPPPYAAPVRAIQVKIRAYDSSSRQIREVTVVQDFLPE